MEATSAYGLRINRIRLEFKVNPWAVLSCHIVVLIESDWNLKKLNKTLASVAQKVLIESDWNLKEIKERFYEHSSKY